MPGVTSNLLYVGEGVTAKVYDVPQREREPFPWEAYANDGFSDAWAEYMKKMGAHLLVLPEYLESNPWVDRGSHNFTESLAIFFDSDITHRFFFFLIVGF